MKHMNYQKFHQTHGEKGSINTGDNRALMLNADSRQSRSAAITEGTFHSPIRQQREQCRALRIAAIRKWRKFDFLQWEDSNTPSQTQLTTKMKTTRHDGWTSLCRNLSFLSDSQELTKYFWIWSVLKFIFLKCIAHKFSVVSLRLSKGPTSVHQPFPKWELLAYPVCKEVIIRVRVTNIWSRKTYSM